jgi:hypothetical protein
MADKSQFSIVTYERRPGHWRAAVTPFAQSGLFIRGSTTSRAFSIFCESRGFPLSRE